MKKINLLQHGSHFSFLAVLYLLLYSKNELRMVSATLMASKGIQVKIMFFFQTFIDITKTARDTLSKRRRRLLTHFILKCCSMFKVN